MKKEYRHSVWKNVLVYLGIAAFLCFIFKLWIILLPILFVMLMVAVRPLFHKQKKQEGEPESLINAENAGTRNNCDSAYRTVVRQINEYVRNRYPEAKWVWAQPDAYHRIENGEDVFIFLNRGGGYRRAKVKLINGQVSEIEFLTCVSETVQKDGADVSDVKNESPAEALPDNYDLLAYEWVESRIMDLNGRFNEAAGQGITELLLEADELPVPESWPSVCAELKRAGLDDAECVREGIKIKFLQN